MNALARQSLDKMVYLKQLASQLMQYIVEHVVPYARTAMVSHLEGGITKEQALAELERALEELSIQAMGIEEHKDMAADLSGVIALYDRSATAAGPLMDGFYDLLGDCFKYHKALLEMRNELLRR